LICWSIGHVRKMIYECEEIQEIEVETDQGAKGRAISYPAFGWKVEEGDTVLLNTTAEELALGSGGVHFVHAVLNRPILDNHMMKSTPGQDKGHIMKLRYTSMQMATLSVEEPVSPYYALFQGKGDLKGTPVLTGELHSMLPALVSWIRYEWKRERVRNSNFHDDRDFPQIAYIMTDGAALPIAWSQHVRELKRLGWIKGTVTVGHAFGGDLEAVNLYTGLQAAKEVLKAEIILVMMGPGIVGTGTPYGFSGTEVADIIHATRVLGGLPIAIPRISSSDLRIRHQGVSHHSLMTLGKLSLAPAVITLPLNPEINEFHSMIDRQIEEAGWKEKHWVVQVSVGSEEINTALSDYPQSITTMGRDHLSDPIFFQTLGAAARFTLRWLALDDSDRRNENRRSEIVKKLEDQSMIWPPFLSNA
jgi:hypothetical protein